MIEKTQADIMKHWQGDISKPKVSVCCLAYNHAPYIADALDGFLKQETNFPFEVIINDDCSTDNTADIIKQYQEKYPLIIKPIFQTENQYSKGVLPLSELVYPNTQGEFLALCEGDDYWLESKLQRQYDIMVADDKLVFSFHNVNEYNCHTHEQKLVPAYQTKKKYIDAKVNLSNLGSFTPTCSIMLKRKHYDLYIELAQKLRQPEGDMIIQALYAIIGEVAFIEKPLAVYRRNALGSWTERKQYLNKAHGMTRMRNMLHLHNELKHFEHSKYLYIPYAIYAGSYANQESSILKKIKCIISNMPYAHGVHSVAFNTLYFMQVCKTLIRRLPLLNRYRNIHIKKSLKEHNQS